MDCPAAQAVKVHLEVQVYLDYQALQVQRVNQVFPDSQVHQAFQDRKVLMDYQEPLEALVHQALKGTLAVLVQQVPLVKKDSQVKMAYLGQLGKRVIQVCQGLEPQVFPVHKERQGQKVSQDFPAHQEVLDFLVPRVIKDSQDCPVFQEFRAPRVNQAHPWQARKEALVNQEHQEDQVLQVLKVLRVLKAHVVLLAMEATREKKETQASQGKMDSRGARENQDNLDCRVKMADQGSME